MLKTTLAAVLIFGTASIALATEFDGNMENRYPQATSLALQTKSVALPTQAAPSNWMDHASQSFGGGY
jgi:hypothetical protein